MTNEELVFTGDEQMLKLLPELHKRRFAIVKSVPVCFAADILR